MKGGRRKGRVGGGVAVVRVGGLGGGGVVVWGKQETGQTLEGSFSAVSKQIAAK